MTKRKNILPKAKKPTDFVTMNFKEKVGKVHHNGLVLRRHVHGYMFYDDAKVPPVEAGGKKSRQKLWR